ncbi:hypothetical protein IV435_10870 [Rahnella sp. SAP-29]|nr:hypothetical protein [Rahnella laticis]
MANGHCGPAKPQEAQIRIRTTFNIKNSFCGIYTNEVLGLNNRKSAYFGRGFGISSTNSMLFLENGKNSITLEIGALGWFSDENIDDTERATFNPQSSCKIELVSFENKKKVILASIEVVIDDHGRPTLMNNSNSITTQKKVLAEQIEPGHFDPEYFDDKYFPKNMEVYKFTQEVYIRKIPIWKWQNATRFEGSITQMEALRNAYLDMAKIITSGNRDSLKKYDEVALNAWSVTTGDSEDEILESQYPRSDLEGGKLKINPVNWNDYAVRVMNKGRLVQLYNKSKPSFSPLSYYKIDENGEDYLGSFAPIFSLINGEFIPVI